MPHPNEIFWPELHPSLMPSHFNNYPQLLLAEGDSWFAWGYLGFDVQPNLLNRQGPTEAAYNKFVTDFDKKFGGFPGMMGVATYEGLYIAAQAVENAGTLNKDQVRDAIAQIQMPQMVENMKDQTISFSPDYRESKFALTMEQFSWNESMKETRPKIVWPDDLKETSFVLPEWFEPGQG